MLPAPVRLAVSCSCSSCVLPTLLECSQVRLCTSMQCMLLPGHQCPSCPGLQSVHTVIEQNFRLDSMSEARERAVLTVLAAGIAAAIISRRWRRKRRTRVVCLWHIFFHPPPPTTGESQASTSHPIAPLTTGRHHPSQVRVHQVPWQASGPHPGGPDDPPDVPPGPEGHSPARRRGRHR